MTVTFIVILSVKAGTGSRMFLSIRNRWNRWKSSIVFFALKKVPSVFSSIGFSVLVQLFKEDTKNNMVILLPMIIIYSFPNLLYQEYVEPLILIIFFLGIKTNLQKVYFSNISLSNFIFLSYFAIYLVGSIYFKHFAFDSYEKWKIFLNVQ